MPLGPGRWNHRHHSCFLVFPFYFFPLLHVCQGEEEEEDGGRGEGGRGIRKPRRWGRRRRRCGGSDVSGRPLASNCLAGSKKFRLGNRRRRPATGGTGCFWKEGERKGWDKTNAINILKRVQFSLTNALQIQERTCSIIIDFLQPTKNAHHLIRPHKEDTSLAMRQCVHTPFISLFSSGPDTPARSLPHPDSPNVNVRR